MNNAKTLSSYLSELEAAWQAAYEKTRQQIEANETPTSLTDCVRYALLQSSLNTFAENLTPKIVARLFETGVWTLEDILTLISIIPDHYRKAQNYVALLETEKLDTDLMVKVREKALETAKAIDFPAYRSEIMEKLSAYAQLEDQINELEQSVDAAIAYIEIPYGNNGYELCKLIEKLPKEMLPKTEAKILALKNAEARAWTLAYLARRTEGDHQYTLLEEGVRAAAQIKPDVNKANALLQLASQLSGDLVPQALDLALSLKESDWRPRAIEGLMDKLDENQVKRVLESMLEVENEWWRVDGLISVAANSIGETQVRALQNLLLNKSGKIWGWIESASTNKDTLINALHVANTLEDKQHRSQTRKRLNKLLQKKQKREQIKKIDDLEERANAFLVRVEQTADWSDAPTSEDAIYARLTIQAIEDQTTQDRLWAKYNALMERGSHETSTRIVSAIELEGILQTKWEEDRANELASVIGFVPEDLLPVIVERSKKFLEWLHRDAVLNKLAPRLNSDILRSAIQDVADYEDTTSLADVLRYLAPYLDQPQKERALIYALDMILAIGVADWHITDPLLELRSALEGDLREKATANLPDELKSTTYEAVMNQRQAESLQRLEDNPELKKQLNERIQVAKEYYAAQQELTPAPIVPEPQNPLIELLEDLSQTRHQKRASVFWSCVGLSELVDEKALEPSIIPIITSDIIEIHKNWHWP